MNPLLAGLGVLAGLFAASQATATTKPGSGLVKPPAGGTKPPPYTNPPKPSSGWTPWRYSQADTLAMVIAGKATYRLVELPSSPGVWVFEDALKIDGVRVPVSAGLTDDIARTLDLIPTTAALEDLIWQDAAVRVYPRTYDPGRLGGEVLTSEEAVTGFSKYLDEQIAGRPGLVASVGKSWILDNRALGQKGRAVNYGLASPLKPNAKEGPWPSTDGKYVVWQQPSTRHDYLHWDYSQTCRLCKLSPGARMPTGAAPLKATRLFY